MIASWIAKAMVRKSFDQFGFQGDAKAGFGSMASNVTYDLSLDISQGVTVKSKREVLEWFQKWYAQFPSRKRIPRNITFAAWPLGSSNVVIVEWTCEETDKEGKLYKYDGVSVTEMKGSEVVRVTEYIGCKGLPQITTLIKPTAKAQSA